MCIELKRISLGGGMAEQFEAQFCRGDVQMTGGDKIQGRDGQRQLADFQLVGRQKGEQFRREWRIGGHSVPRGLGGRATDGADFDAYLLQQHGIEPAVQQTGQPIGDFTALHGDRCAAADHAQFLQRNAGETRMGYAQAQCVNAQRAGQPRCQGCDQQGRGRVQGE